MKASGMIKRGIAALFATWIAVTTLCGQALAMRVSPMVVEMESRGSDTVARIEVQNVNQSNLAFETRVYRMTIADDGSIVETPADDRFLIFPPQGVLPPGGRQVIRIQWVGAPDTAASEGYYVSVDQLPVTFAPTTAEAVAAQVQILYHMRALVVVAPPGSKPNVQASSAKQLVYQPPAPAGTNDVPPPQDGVEVTLTNKGQRHAMMANFGWRLEGLDTKGEKLRVDISPEELNRAVGTGYVPALGSRKFLLPVPGFGSQPIRLTFIQ